MIFIYVTFSYYTYFPSTALVAVAHIGFETRLDKTWKYQKKPMKFDCKEELLLQWNDPGKEDHLYYYYIEKTAYSVSKVI